MARARNPLNDDHYDGNDDQIDDLKELVHKLRDCLEDALGWMQTGKVDGVGFDELQIVESIQAVLMARTETGRM